jgi:thioester reductase-like protein
VQTLRGRLLAAADQATEGAVLLTGVTGFVGMELLARLLERTRRPVICLVRGAHEADSQQRLLRTLATLLGNSERHEDRLVALCADLERPALGLSASVVDELAAVVSDIVHGAASVSFELGLAQSRAINVEGTRRMLELAALCRRRGGLRSFSYISTAYVAGEHHGHFGEDDLEAGQRFRNPYERTKFEAEQVVRAHAAELPVTIFRPSIIVGDHRTGWTPVFNVLYAPLRAFAQGTYSVVPARRSAPVDAVSVDYVADGIFALITSRPADGRTYHLTAGDDATTVGELVDLAAELLGRPAPVSLPPSLYRRVLHPLLVRAVDSRRRRALRRTEIYFPYFAVDTVFDDTRTRTALAPMGVRRVPLDAYFDRLVGFATRTNWGREAITRHAARLEVAP